MSQAVVGMTHSDFVKEAVKRLPAAQEEFVDLYNTQMLELKIGRAVMSSYNAAPRKVKKNFESAISYWEMRGCWFVNADPVRIMFVRRTIPTRFYIIPPGTKKGFVK